MRDPPGGGSSASYENAESTLLLKVGTYDVFDGQMEAGSAFVGLDAAAVFCAGASVVASAEACTEVFQLEGLLGGNVERTHGKSLDNGFDGERSLSRTYT